MNAKNCVICIELPPIIHHFLPFLGRILVKFQQFQIWSDKKPPSRPPHEGRFFGGAPAHRRVRRMNSVLGAFRRMSSCEDIFGRKLACLRRQTSGRRPPALISIGGVSEQRHAFSKYSRLNANTYLRELPASPRFG